jgi:hypothetical protein
LTKVAEKEKEDGVGGKGGGSEEGVGVERRSLRTLGAVLLVIGLGGWSGVRVAREVLVWVWR